MRIKNRNKNKTRGSKLNRAMKVRTVRQLKHQQRPRQQKKSGTQMNSKSVNKTVDWTNNC